MVPSHVVLACEGCGGVWLDNEVTQQLVKRILDGQVLAIADRTADVAEQADAALPYRDAAAGTGACPICEQALTAVRTSAAAHGVDGIELEVCGAHGTWFDARELRFMAESMDRYDAAGRAAAAAKAAQDKVEVEAAVDEMGLSVINRVFRANGYQSQFRVQFRPPRHRF
jgi:Zn-finger nucleic acid-binding protein